MFESKLSKGKANGYTPLGADAKVPAKYLPLSVLPTMNPNILSTTTIPTGYNALLIGPVSILDDLIIENNAILIIL